MDREQGAAEMLASRGIRLHPIISMFNLLDVLREAKRIDSQMAQSVRDFIQDNHTFRYSRASSPKSGRCAKAFPCHLHIRPLQPQGGEWVRSSCKETVCGKEDGAELCRPSQTIQHVTFQQPLCINLVHIMKCFETSALLCHHHLQTFILWPQSC